jgi:rhodanese-related sulfurtransferase
MIRDRKLVPMLVFCLLWAVSAGSSVAAEKKSPDNIPGSTKVDAEGLIELVEDKPDLIMIDSRISSDRIQGHIEGSVSLPDERTNCETLAEVLPSREVPVLFYCNGPKCGRSAVAVNVALSCQYNNIYWFRGGFEEWKHKKYPYIKE